MSKYFDVLKIASLTVPSSTQQQQLKSFRILDSTNKYPSSLNTITSQQQQQIDSIRNMNNNIYIVIGLIQLYVFIKFINIWRQQQQQLQNLNGRKYYKYALLPIIVNGGAVYDNFIIASGIYIGEGQILKLLNLPRFILHALTVPTLIIFGYGIVHRCTSGSSGSGNSQYSNKFVHGCICLLASVLIGVGSYQDIINLNLQPKYQSGTIRYINASNHGPPIFAIITCVLVLVFSGIVWFKTTNPLYFICTVLMFVCASSGSKTVLWIANIGEIFFILGSLIAEQIAHQYDSKNKIY